jgi:glycerol kinase
VVASCYREHRQYYPQPGWVEHDPLEILAATSEVCRGALAAAGATPAQIAGLGITNQRETTVVWDRRSGRPLYPAIVWQCTRTTELCQKLLDAGHDATFRRKTGLPIATYFSGPKIRWILDHVAGAREMAQAGDALFGNMDSWLIWNLTGAHVTDPSNASRTMLMNLDTLDWDDELLGILDIPRAMLPAIHPSSAPAGYGTTAAAGPLGGAVRVCGDLGDQQAALFGQACYAAGEAKNTYGTGSFLLLNTGATPVRSQNGLLTTVAYSLGTGQTAYALEGSIAITGAAVQWLRDNLGLIEHAAETEAIAASVADAGGVYFVPAFSGLFAPHWDMYARGAILGLTRYVTKAHIVRATLEAICYQSREVVEAMVADAGVTLQCLKVDGGAARNNFLLQLQADILGAGVVRPVIEETTALGAAYAAGLAAGLWGSLDELRANWGADREFGPQWEPARREAGYRGWRRAVERTKGWIEH